MAEPTTWTQTSAWAGITAVTHAGAGVVARPLDTLVLASVHARKGRGAALKAKVKARFKIDLPPGPKRAAREGVAFVGTGPGAWMAVGEGVEAGWLDALAADLEGLASVTDQTGSYAAMRLEGPAVLDALAKGVFLDLHETAFPVGSAAGVSIAHIGAVVWRRERLVFEVLTFRSYAASFWHWLDESAAEYGLTVAG
jgi:sarcosine oxidase subunit gamma